MLKLRVPATTANLGPGFDTLGLALSIYNYVSIKLLPQGQVKISVEGPTGSEFIAQDENNLVVRAARRVFTKVGAEPSGLELHMELHAPLARGLGSSASAIVAGMAGANELLGRPLSSEELLDEMVEMEGHPDNVVPCYRGGLTASLALPEGLAIQRTSPHESLQFVLFVPEYELETSRARAAIPKTISVRDAVFNISRVIHVYRGIESGEVDMLSSAMEDCLHQPYRIPLIKGYQETADAALEAGAAGVCISGAGPTILAIVKEENAESVHDAGLAILSELGVSAMGLIAQADNEGCTIMARGDVAANVSRE
jgi:homoserine kinase